MEISRANIPFSLQPNDVSKTMRYRKKSQQRQKMCASSCASKQVFHRRQVIGNSPSSSASATQNISHQLQSHLNFASYQRHKFRKTFIALKKSFKLRISHKKRVFRFIEYLAEKKFFNVARNQAGTFSIMVKPTCVQKKRAGVSFLVDVTTKRFSAAAMNGSK